MRPRKESVKIGHSRTGNPRNLLMTTINDIADLVEVLRNHPDWLETLQDILLADYGKDNNAQLDEILRRLDRLDDRLENQEGAFYEARVARNIQSLAGQQPGPGTGQGAARRQRPDGPGPPPPPGRRIGARRRAPRPGQSAPGRRRHHRGAPAAAATPSTRSSRPR